jgi:omega-amidase
MESFTAAIAQMDIALADKEENLKSAAKFASDAALQGADFLCLPEYFSTGSVPGRFGELAESIPGKTTEGLCDIAKKNNINIVASLAEKDGSSIYNTAVFVGNGKVLGKHRKIHLFLDEGNFVAHGNSCEVVSTKQCKLGMMVCYDAIFPEVARKLALKGAEIILVPANWPDPFQRQWELAIAARALDNQAWVVATNCCGKDERFTYFGKSRVVNPYGETVCECGRGEELLVFGVDGGKADEFKNTVNFLKDAQMVKK